MCRMIVCKMNYFAIFVLCLLFFTVNGVLYDRANGNELHGEKAKNDHCAIDTDPCGPQEDRRIDGTCNNYGVPAGGASGGPYKRMTAPETLGSDLLSARDIRTSLLTQARDDDPPRGLLSSVASSFMDFVNSDISALDVEKDADEEGHCCDAKDNKDSRCFPVLVPGNNSKSDKECLEFYRAKTFEDLGCARDYREQINFQTPTLDLSQMYGYDEYSHKAVRKGENGSLNEFYKDQKVARRRRDLINKRKAGAKEICVPSGNKTTCYEFGFPNANNFDLRTTIIGTWFIREHNRLAKALHKLNPCWKDDRLFKVARRINIATIANIFLYELLPLFMGYRNMVNSGLVSQQIEYVTLYEDAVPLVYAEYEIAMKFFLTLRNGRIKKYDDNNRYTGDIPLNETLYSHELLGKGSSYDDISRGLILQKAAKIDDNIDPEVPWCVVPVVLYPELEDYRHYAPGDILKLMQSFFRNHRVGAQSSSFVPTVRKEIKNMRDVIKIGETFCYGNEKAPDLATSGVQRGRDMGIPGYNTYRQICRMPRAKKFDDFLDTMPLEKVEALKKLYKNVDAVELLAGILSESLIPNAFVGPTLYCIMAKQLQLFRYSDRHWFERGDQFHSFTYPQLQEIRKTSMARVACDNSQAIDFIQPKAFQATGPGNMPLPCSFITGLDLTPWWDSSCGKNPPRKTPDSKVNQPYSYMEILTFFDDMLRNRNMSIV